MPCGIRAACCFSRPYTSGRARGKRCAVKKNDPVKATRRRVRMVTMKAQALGIAVAIPNHGAGFDSRRHLQRVPPKSVRPAQTPCAVAPQITLCNCTCTRTFKPSSSTHMTRSFGSNLPHTGDANNVQPMSPNLRSEITLRIHS